MQNVFVSIIVNENNRREIKTINVSDLSITELVKLREEQLNESYNKIDEKTISVLDALIREEAEQLMLPYNNTSYVSQYKKNKKEEKRKKKQKIRRK